MTSGSALAGEALVRHDVAVSNIIYGVANFMTVRLPEIWDLAPGVGHPEIVAVHERNKRKWIVSGQAWYVVYHRELGWAMELVLESRTRRPIKARTGAENLVVQGHEACVRRWQRRRGLLHRRTITYIEVTYNCESSDRQIRVELSGRCPAEGFEAMLAVIPEWYCH